jgi:peptidyl-prolyl cis-trans isomerase D
VLRHESQQLGIRPTRDEIVDAVRNLEAFRGPSGFDHVKYDEFAQNLLTPNGFTETDLEELAADQIRLNRIRQLISIGVTVPEAESKANYEQFYGKNIASVIRLRAGDFDKDVKVTDDDIKKYYEAHKDELKTDEQRKVEFVKLGLTDEQKKLAGKERIDALQKLADRATDFTQGLLEKGADFKQVAAKFQVPVQTTGEFSEGKPDPQLNADPQVGETAFKLTQQEPNSDPVQVQDGFYILHLAGINQPRPLTLEEAKPKIVDAIRTQRTREMVMNKGAKAAQDLKAALKTRVPFSTAIGQANLKAEKVEPFMLIEEIEPKTAGEKPKKEPADMESIKNVAAQLEPGEVSEFIPITDGGLIVYLEKREPPDPAKYEQTRASFDERDLKSKRQVVFYEWLNDRRRDAKVELAKG